MSGERPVPNPHISEEAAEWFVEFRTGRLDERARQRFDLWIRTSPEHLRAYLEYAAIWEEGGRLDRQGTLDTEELLQRVEEEGNVVPLAAHVPAPAVQAPVRRARRSLLRAGLAAGVAVAALAAGTWVLLEQRSTYATSVGEQRSITLEDGSLVELNTRSRIKVRLSDAERRVELLEGQALFHVAKDPRRPFTVRTDRSLVRAVGTRFDVYRKPEGTVVTVLEGRVTVSGLASVATARPAVGPLAPRREPDPLSSAAARVLLSAGEQATVPRNGGVLRKPGRTDPQTIAAWTQRRLVFESATLQEIVRELNRYSTRRFVVDASAPSELRLSGVFSTTDMDLLVRFLRERPGIRVEALDDQVVIRGASAPVQQRH